MKKLFLTGIFMLVYLLSQAQKPNWQNKDLKADSIFGISTDKAYTELLRRRKAKAVVVAVIDAGIDTTHEDLKSVLWANPKEIPGNGKDDDHNGYVDDLHGWNFIGGVRGNVQYDNLELTRLIRKDKGFYDSLSNTLVPEKYRANYQAFRKMEKDYDHRLTHATETLQNVNKLKKTLDTILYKTGKDSIALQDLQNYQPHNDEEENAKNTLIIQLSENRNYSTFKKTLDVFYDHYKSLAEYQLNIGYDPREIVGDNYGDVEQRNYGNNDVYGMRAEHGTHVAGIIGAIRNNGLGIDGIADHVAIMSIRIVPEGDERDKDVANGIRYAVDNGAKVINMSFGKPYSPYKKVVDEAIKYAMGKDVLLIHAAGNDGEDLDNPENPVFPTRRYEDGDSAVAWIEVGATNARDDSSLIAPFSNYGKTKVDVFAPGVHIYSTVPGSKYEYLDGTSMAAPVVTGLAALIREYYPKLTAVQVKEIIMRSVVKRDVLKDKCVSGGVVNAYNALVLAGTYK